MQTVWENVPLAPLTTFKIGGPARYLTEVRTGEQIRESIEWARARGMRFIVLSGGSNVLVPDEGLDALVIHVVEGAHSFDGSIVTADAGCDLLGLTHSASENDLGGWEKLAGIPGTIGGAVRGNAGAFGSEIKDFVTGVRALNSVTGECRDFVNPDMDFSYRHSFFKDNPEWIIITVKIALRGIPKKESERLARETIAEREKRHLQNVRAAGSFFMNPVAPPEIVAMFEQEKGVKSREGRVPAGWLIEKAGMKGAVVGGAVASEQHPNYIVNSGTATSHDVRNLAQQIKLRVHEHFNVELQEEAALL